MMSRSQGVSMGKHKLSMTRCFKCVGSRVDHSSRGLAKRGVLEAKTEM